MTRSIAPASPEAPRPLLPRRKVGRHVVIVGERPGDWKPHDPGDVPADGLRHPEPLASNLTLAQAIAEVRCFNQDALRHGGELWACILFRAKCSKEVVR